MSVALALGEYAIVEASDQALCVAVGQEVSWVYRKGATLCLFYEDEQGEAHCNVVSAKDIEAEEGAILKFKNGELIK